MKAVLTENGGVEREGLLMCTRNGISMIFIGEGSWVYTYVKPLNCTLKYLQFIVC